MSHSRPTISSFINLLANLRLSLLSLDLGPCLRECPPIPDAADTERVVPSVSSFVNWHCHCPFPRCSHGRRQFTTGSEIRSFVFAATCWTREKPTRDSKGRFDFSVTGNAASSTSIVGRRPPDTSRRRVKAVNIVPEEVPSRIVVIRKMNRRRGVLIRLIMFERADKARFCEKHNPVLSDDRPY